MTKQTTKGTCNKHVTNTSTCNMTEATTKESWEKRLKEKLAAIEHQRWADWQSWCHQVLRENCPSPGLEKALERWDKQIATTYKDLTEKEKNSDREQVNRYWPLIHQAIAKQVGEIEKEAMKGFPDSDVPSEWKKFGKEWEAFYKGWTLRSKKLLDYLDKLKTNTTK